MREGGRGRENDRGRENQTQWKSWRNKDGIQPEEHVDEESTKEGWQHVRRNNQGGNRLQRNYQLKEKATSFFLQNLPEELSEKELWRECINYGHVVDAYISDDCMTVAGEVRSGDEDGSDGWGKHGVGFIVTPPTDALHAPVTPFPPLQLRHEPDHGVRGEEKRKMISGDDNIYVYEE
ncbi:hypothetical protein E3N88_13502 [Mikania micrantha]|uniref:RRM domain-containing protein n=1 Tax=Mikania micrantha TaxID=192012 RepID=A0A5N6P8Z3_9ASTR|nr:hypothetical protein E3N88_13502 [Mikania micrantha]